MNDLTPSLAFPLKVEGIITDSLSLQGEGRGEGHSLIMTEKQNILVIRHGALGDVILTTGHFAAIRAHHPDAHITLLTTKPYAALLKDSPYFDAFVIDAKPKFWQFRKVRALKRFFREGQFTRVYDLQTSDRSTWYYRLLPTPKPEFSGLAKGASHRHNTPERTRLHTLDRQNQQLAIAGIAHCPPPDVSWLSGEGRGTRGKAGEHKKYALLVPGGSAHRPEKRWPEAQYAELAAWLCGQGIQPVLIGTGAEAEVLEKIESGIQNREGIDSIPNSGFSILNLCNQTSFGDIAELARGAVCAVGNDTGPMHLIAAAGCPSVVLFNTRASNPDLCAPRGGHVSIIQRDDLTTLSAKEVADMLKSVENSLKIG